MVAGDFLHLSNWWRVNAVRNEVVLDSGYAWVFVHSVESAWDVFIFSGSALDGTLKSQEKVLSSPKFLAVWCSLHESELGFVICQTYKLVSSQLSFNKV